METNPTDRNRTDQPRWWPEGPTPDFMQAMEYDTETKVMVLAWINGPCPGVGVVGWTRIQIAKNSRVVSEWAITYALDSDGRLSQRVGECLKLDTGQPDENQHTFFGGAVIDWARDVFKAACNEHGYQDLMGREDHL